MTIKKFLYSLLGDEIDCKDNWIYVLNYKVNKIFKTVDLRGNHSEKTSCDSPDFLLGSCPKRIEEIDLVGHSAAPRG